MRTPATTPFPGSEERDYVIGCPSVLVDGLWIPTDEVEFVDISEDFQGYDIMTFNYKGKEHKSKIRILPK